MKAYDVGYKNVTNVFHSGYKLATFRISFEVTTKNSFSNLLFYRVLFVTQMKTKIKVFSFNDKHIFVEK